VSWECTCDRSFALSLVSFVPSSVPFFLQFEPLRMCFLFLASLQLPSQFNLLGGVGNFMESKLLHPIPMVRLHGGEDPASP